MFLHDGSGVRLSFVLLGENTAHEKLANAKSQIRGASLPECPIPS